MELKSLSLELWTFIPLLLLLCLCNLFKKHYIKWCINILLWDKHKSQLWRKPFEVKCLQGTETCPVAYNIANYYDLDDWEYSPTLWRKVHCRKYSSVTEFSVSHSDYQLLRVNPNPIIPKVVCHCFVVFDHLLFGIYQDNLCVEIISHQWHQNYISSSKKKNKQTKHS